MGNGLGTNSKIVQQVLDNPRRFRRPTPDEQAVLNDVWVPCLWLYDREHFVFVCARCGYTLDYFIVSDRVAIDRWKKENARQERSKTVSWLSEREEALESLEAEADKIRKELTKFKSGTPKSRLKAIVLDRLVRRRYHCESRELGRFLTSETRTARCKAQAEKITNNLWGEGRSTQDLAEFTDRVLSLFDQADQESGSWLAGEDGLV